LVGQPEGKRTPGGPGHRWENTRKGIGCKGSDWLNLALEKQ
jgi:hypothetical protein